MCILCVASRWSRRIITLLPWLVIPLIILWALSQLLPPSFRFEITSPRLACLAVLLVSLCWYELVMPKVSSWRERRRALLRERKRIEAQEVAKWRKEAIRRCRNCYMPYKDQKTPGSGRFMCTFCGHVSKRPVLDVPDGSTQQMGGNMFSMAGFGMGVVNNGGGISASRSSRIWNGRMSQDRSRGWIEGVNWSMNSNTWFGGPWPSNSFYSGTTSGWTGAGAFISMGIFGRERCSAGESYFGVFWFLFKVISQLSFFLVCTFGKLWKMGYDGDDDIDEGHRSYHNRGYSIPSPERKWEKARRKAEEKRLARIEKEQMEAEERKQREEVARLVEERRRQRDEKLEVEKESEREAAAEREREMRREREAERRKQEKAKEKEKAMTKEKVKDQEFDELRKRKVKENEKKTDVDRNEIEDSVKPLKPAKVELCSKGIEIGTKAYLLSKSACTKNLKNSTFTEPKSVVSSTKSTPSFWRRTFSSRSSNNGGKASKAVIPSTSSSLTTSNSCLTSTGKTEGSSSAWNKMHWTNVWGKTTKNVADDAPNNPNNSCENLNYAPEKMNEGSKNVGNVSQELNDGSKKCVMDENTEKIADPDKSGGAKDLIAGTVVSTSTSHVSQQPIAPPSNLSDSWDNLFSGPMCLPPVELPVGSAYQEIIKSRMGSNIHQVSYVPSSLLSAQSYFGDTAGSPCTYSNLTNSAISCSLPPSVSSSINMFDFSGEEIQDSLDNIRSNVELNPLSALNLAGTLNPPLQHSFNRNEDDLMHILEPWDASTFLGENSNGDSNDPRWNHWNAPVRQRQEVNFLQTSQWDPSFQNRNNQMQSFSPNLTEAGFKVVSPPSSSFFSCSQSDNINPSYSESSCAPMFGSKNWSNRSASNSMMHAWEDADMNQIIPAEFVDCITYSVMQDPVITADGHSYERSAIEAWLKLHDTSPKTGEILPPPPGGDGTGVDKTLRPNHILRGQIIEFMEHLARGIGSYGFRMNSGWKGSTSDVNSSLWSETEGDKTHIRGFYPMPGSECVWSFGERGI